MPSIAPYANAGGDGYVLRDGDSSWATARSAASGTSVDASNALGSVDTQKYDGVHYLRRGFLSFDTGSIPDNKKKQEPKE